MMSPPLIIWDVPEVRISFILLYTLVFLTCIIGNLCVILVVTLHWRMRSITNFCLANLALADLCVGIFCIYQNLYIILGKNWIFGKFACKMHYFIHEVSHTASILILVVICIERYLAVIYPLKCKEWLTLNRLKFAVSTVWLMSGAYSAPRLYYTEAREHINFGDGQLEMLCTPNHRKYNAKLYDLINMGLLFLLPLLLITLLYSIVGFTLWKSNQNHSNLQAANQNEQIHASERMRCSCDIGKFWKWLTTNREKRTQKAKQHIEMQQISKTSLNLRIDIEEEQSNTIQGSILLNEKSSSNSAGNQLVLEKASFHTSEPEQQDQTETQNPALFKPLSPKQPNKTRIRFQATTTTAKRIRVIKMLIIIVLCFGLCNLPYHARKLWQIFGKEYVGGGTFIKIFTATTFLLMYAASSINPLLYAFFSQNFRQSFMEIIKCQRRRFTL